MVPCQSLLGRWCRFLHRCVSDRVIRSLSLPLTVHSDSYDIFAINIASTMLGYVYGAGERLTLLPYPATPSLIT